MSATGHRQTHGFAHPARNVAALALQPGMRVADFGSGSGAYALAIAEQLGGTGRVYAIDIQKDLLRRLSSEAAHRGYKHIDMIWADLEVPRASKLAEHSIDLVLISNLLFQVHDKSRVIREAKRIVKTAGRIVIIDWSESFGGMGPIKTDVVSKDAALTLVRAAGLELVREFPAGAHHYGLIMQIAHLV